MERLMSRLIDRTVFRRIAGKAGLAASLVILLAPILFVFFWVVSLSLKHEIDNTAYPPIFLPPQPTLDNFRRLFEETPFALYFWNSMLVSGGATAAALLLGVPAGYGIARSKSRGAAVLILVARMTPGLSYLIPLYSLFQMIGLIGSVLPIAIVHLVITLPIVVYVMIGYFEALPAQLEEAATIDGCSAWQSFIYIAVPLARPGIVVGAILSFIYSWNNFVFGAVFASRTTRTMPVAVYNMLTFEQFAWGPLAAAAIVVMLPVLVLTVLIQKEIVGGLTTGGVKGG
jgi:multiple sugar transport system permease protein